MNDETFQKWIQSRTIANALYSLYKDARAQDEAYADMMYQSLIHTHGGDPETSKKTITEMRKLIDKT